jgi:hypothetical protein
MAPLDFTFHLLGFLAPALFVGLAVAFGARFVGATPQRPRWWAQAAINITVGVAVLGTGLWHFGVDGKMATYAALVFAVAVIQWLCGRAWK